VLDQYPTLSTVGTWGQQTGGVTAFTAADGIQRLGASRLSR